MTQAFSLILFAGLLNGSFAIPSKHMPDWHFENIWLGYAVSSFILLPLMVTLVLFPNLWSVYQLASRPVIFAMILGGVGFGIGQLCFFKALNDIGLGLSFVLNLGVSIALGFLIPLITHHPEKIFSPFGLLTMSGCLLALLGLGLSCIAGQKLEREREYNHHDTTRRHTTRGLLLAATAGVFSACQNISFAETYPLQLIAKQLGASALAASISVWPGFLFFSFIPFAIFMLIKLKKQHHFRLYKIHHHGKYYGFIVFMGIAWYGSLVGYSQASQWIGELGPIIGWPLFMIAIILSSNFWGWRYQEWAGSSPKVVKTMLAGIGLLIFAIFLLALGSLKDVNLIH